MGLGILTYILDRQYCQGFYKGLYDMFHKEPSEKPFGFIFGQSTGRKFVIATLVSTAQSIGMFVFTGFHSNPFVELVLWFVEIPAMVIGFMFGYWLWPWWSKRTKLYEAVDKIDERIERHHEERHKESSTPKSGQSGSAPTPAPTPVSPITPSPVQAAQEPEPPKMSAEERIRRYASGQTVGK